MKPYQNPKYILIKPIVWVTEFGIALPMPHSTSHLYYTLQPYLYATITSGLSGILHSIRSLKAFRKFIVWAKVQKEKKDIATPGTAV